MESLSREAILRMVGLHDAAHMVRQLNAIQLSLEEEQGRMVAYWTEIRKSEKEVTLLAGRVSANETSIGPLQVTAQQLTASVSSLTTTVNGHTTSIGQLQITANSLTASVSSLTTTVDGHTTKIAALEITDSSISNRVTVIEGDYVKNAQISLMVVKDGNGYISNALIDADDIKFVFTREVSWYWQSEQAANKRMGLDSGGNLWIDGEYKGGSITGNITVGTGTNKMYIQPNASNGADLVGNSGGTEVLKLGFVAGEGTWSSITPALEMKYYAVGSLNFTATLKPYYLIIKNNTSGLEANIQADRMSIDGPIWATSFAIESGSTIYTGVTRTVTIGSTTLTIKGGIITDVS